MNGDERIKVYINGHIICADEKDSRVSVLVTKGDRIVSVGNGQGSAGYSLREAEIYDLNGRTLMPGMIDTHYHPILRGLLDKETDGAIIDIFYPHCKTLEECFGKLRKAVTERKPGEWISLMGYEPMLLPEKRHPTLEELDRIAPENPVHFMHGGGHVCMYNSKALEYLGIYGPDDAKGFPVDEVEVTDGKLTGMVRGHTHFNLWKKVEYGKDQQENAALKSYRHCIENGVTSICDCGELGRDSYHIIQKLTRDGRFRVRTSMMLHNIFGRKYSYAENEHWMELGLMSGLGDENFRIGACKFMIDGGSGVPSCYTRKPYSHDPSLPREKGWEREEVAAYVKKINEAECQATAHAIGDGAVEFMVEAYEKAFEEDPRPDLRHRIEHCTLADEDLIERMGKMNICPSVNISCVTTLGKNYERFYGPERSRYVCALRTMLDNGIKCSLHSDAPSGPTGLSIIDGAVNRYDRQQHHQCDRTQAISLSEAIRCATYNGAYATGEEDIKGSLEPGKLADFIILSENIGEIDPMDIYRVKVDETYIGGERVFKRQEA